MPMVPGAPPSTNANPLAPPQPAPSPEQYLIAAANMHQSGEFQSMPQPTGKALQTGHGPRRRQRLQVVK